MVLSCRHNSDAERVSHAGSGAEKLVDADVENLGEVEAMFVRGDGTPVFDVGDNMAGDVAPTDLQFRDQDFLRPVELETEF